MSQTFIIRHDSKIVGAAEADANGIGALSWFSRNKPAYSMDHATTHEGYSVDVVDSIDCHDVESILNAICEREGLTLESVFVPFSKSRNAKPAHGREQPWRSLNWEVTLKRRGRHVLVADYAQGEAHAPAYKAKAPAGWLPREVARARHDAISREIETGRCHRIDRSFPGLPIEGPSIGTVIQSLILDAEVLNYADFAQWANEYGYDTDSRAAERIYRACLDTATKLRAGLGEPLMTEISWVAQFN